MSKFLVTNATGYIGLHVVEQLLKAGYFVRGAVKSLSDEKNLIYLKNFFKYDPQQMELVDADLLDPHSWKTAVEGIDFIIHSGTPFPIDRFSNYDDLIRSVIEGTLNVLNAAVNSNVKRVVIESCGLAIVGFDPNDQRYDEINWDDPDRMLCSYGKSKVFAEQAVWDFVEQRKLNELHCFEVAVINPGIVLGPLLSPTISPSGSLLLNLFNNQNGKIPDARALICDVRDVATANIQAALCPFAAGHRHLISSSTNFTTLKQWAEILKEEFGPHGFKISTDSDTLTESKTNSKVDLTRMRDILGIEPIDFRKTIIDMAYSFFYQGILSPESIKKTKSFSFIFFNKQ